MKTMVVFVTHPEPSKAKDLAHTLVREGLAACVNIIPGVKSIYSWEGKITEDSECLCVIKTCDQRLKKLEQKVHELHPYSTPEFLALEPSHVSEKYSGWLQAVFKD